MNKTALFSNYYLAPIAYYYYLSKYPEVIEDIGANFVKQTYRNRCYILSRYGAQCLSIPLLNVKKRQATKNVKINMAILEDISLLIMQEIQSLQLHFKLLFF